MTSEQRDSAVNITHLLAQWHEGDDQALARLTPLVYAELRRLAGALLRGERDGHTLQPTALVHDLYLQMSSVRAIHWKCTAQFLAMAARMMRNILVDHARKRFAGKRGAGLVLPIGEAAESVAAPD